MAINHYRDIRILAEVLRVLGFVQSGLPSPQRMFLRDLTLGILCAQSCQLSQIARTLVAKEDLVMEYQRLDRALGKYDLSRAYERAQRLMLSSVDQSHLFIFDPSEVVKPFGKKLEALRLVRDGSEKPRLVRDEKTGKLKEVPVLKPGYPIRVAVSMDPAGGLLPIDLSLYSTAAESFLSSNDESMQVLDTLLQRTSFQPTLVLDQEFDAFSIFRHLMELRQKFIVRVGSDRKFLEVSAIHSPYETTYSREEMIEKHAFLSTKNVISFTHQAGQTRPTLCNFKAARVRLLMEEKKLETFRVRADQDALILIELKLYRTKGVPTLYLLTSTRPITEPELQAAGLAYLARWNIEEYIRFLKQHFELESFLVRDLGRMKNLISAVYIATVILHILTDHRAPYSRGKRNHLYLLEEAMPVGWADRKSRDFFLYAYGRGLAHIVARNRTLLSALNTTAASPIKNAG